MITITVISDLMEQTQRFKTDKQSIAYLKKVKKMHDSKALYKAPSKPKRSDYSKYASGRYKSDLKEWKMQTNASSIKVKISSE